MMKKQNLNLLLLLFFLNITPCAATVKSDIPEELQDSNQLLLVLSPDWDSFKATLKRYERRNPNDKWYLVDKKAIPVVIGKNGLAFGRDWIYSSKDKIKKEGDGKSPAGIYSLGISFGFTTDAHDVIPSMKWDYLTLTSTHICVDDQSSPFYNQLIDRTGISNWDNNTSGEHMRQIVPQYSWGSVINYNTKNVKGAGSCIFLHVWTDSSHGTAGCIAMNAKEVTRILGWLDPAKKPVIALFPMEIYKKISKKWRLPY